MSELNTAHGDPEGRPEPEWARQDLERHACLAQEGYDNPVAQVAFRAGFLLCREYMARFVEQGGDANTAASIRANWIPAFGADPGPPRQYDFAEIVEADDMEVGPWRSKNPGPSVDAAVYALTVMHSLGMTPPAGLSPCAPENGGWLGPQLAAKVEGVITGGGSEGSLPPPAPPASRTASSSVPEKGGC